MQISCPACQQAITVPQAPPLAGTAQPSVTVKSHALRNVLVIAATALVLVGLFIGGWYGYSKLKIRKLPPGLVALWSGDGKGGDSVGGNNMTMTDISFAKGMVGQSFSFNGMSSTIKIPASPSLDVGAGDGFTIMAWIKPTDVNGIHPMFEWPDDSKPVVFEIGLRPSENGVLMSCVTDADGGRFVLSHPGVLTAGIFQHIAYTYDKPSGIGTLYLNGVIVAQRQLSGRVRTKGDLLISHRDTNQGNWSSNRSFAGLMDEIAIYNRALSASEIQAVVTDQSHGEPLPLPTPSTGWFESWMR